MIRFMKKNQAALLITTAVLGASALAYVFIKRKNEKKEKSSTETRTVETKITETKAAEAVQETAVNKGKEHKHA